MRYVAQAFGPDGFGVYQVEWNGGVPSLAKSSATPEVLLTPGFVDIHIHGAFGVDFMEASQGEMATLCDRLAEHGYEAFVPTTVSASASAVLRAVGSLPEHRMVLGFHLEGPFISSFYPGAQPPEAIRSPNDAGPEWDEVFEHPKLRVATLAPELPGAKELIGRLSGRGVIVSMGHTNATFAEARAGFDSGARHATHTFNAMRGIHHREPGMAGYALVEDGLFAELIYDRKHVAREAAELLVRCKPKDKLLAVSDSSMATGLPPGRVFRMWGQDVETWERSVRLKSTRALAGSAITLLDAFRNLADDFGAETAVRCCCVNPRYLLGLSSAANAWIEFDSRLQISNIRRRDS